MHGIKGFVYQINFSILKRKQNKGTNVCRNSKICGYKSANIQLIKRRSKSSYQIQNQAEPLIA